ncbi:MAG TPA: hypothetical protein QGF35_00330 [Dehalococcoidia bacterium]|nr:hypothetical protein [Dehalococcoidia bacterium]
MNERGSRGRGERAGLTKAAVIKAVIEASRASESRGVSVRALASTLAVDPMAVHYWFKGRDSLLDAAANKVLGATVQVGSGPDWESNFREFAYSLWRVVADHPGLEWCYRNLSELPAVENLEISVAAALKDSGLRARDLSNASETLLSLAISLGSGPDDLQNAHFRSALGLLIDGLKMRALERRVAAGEHWDA